MPILSNLPIGEAGITAILGYSVVFLGLVLLMIVISIVGKIFTAKDKKKAVEPVTLDEVPAAEEPKPTAPGTAGEIKLHNVDPKIAAMLMAIVADKLGKPINQLRFISIKEVE